MRSLVLAALLVGSFAAPLARADDAPVAAVVSDAPPAASSTCTAGPEVLPVAAPDTSLQARVKGALAAGDLAVAIVLVLLGGLLTALSPCVYPLIPITLSILGARQASSPVQGFLLSATYVSGMVLLYAALGVAFAAFGVLAGSALQSPLVTIGVALFCIAMAASMFGAFEIGLPASLQTRLSQAGGKGFHGAFIIAAPCTGPVLSFILTLIARDGDLVKGATLMFFYALGMGLPFLVLGTFSQAISRMPKSGAWMEVVKSVFGLMMLGAGIYYLALGLPALHTAMAPLAQYGYVLGPLLVVLGLAAGALQLSFKHSSTGEKSRKGIGVLLATAGLVALIGWFGGSDTKSASSTAAPPIAWSTFGKKDTDAVARLDAALAAAKASCKPMMIDFFAEWCVACKELDKYTYADAHVRGEAQRYETIKVDATDDTEALTALQKRYGVVGLPTVVFVSGRGTVLPDPRITGFVEAPEALATMQRVR